MTFVHLHSLRFLTSCFSLLSRTLIFKILLDFSSPFNVNINQTQTSQTYHYLLKYVQLPQILKLPQTNKHWNGITNFHHFSLLDHPVMPFMKFQKVSWFYCVWCYLLKFLVNFSFGMLYRKWRNKRPLPNKRPRVVIIFLNKRPYFNKRLPRDKRERLFRNVTFTQGHLFRLVRKTMILTMKIYITL